MKGRSALVLMTLLALLAACGSGADGGAPTSATSAPETAEAGTPAASTPPATDWTRFGFDAARTNAAPRGIGPAEVARLRERRISLPGTVDASPIFLAGVRVRGTRRDVVAMTTTYGRTTVLDASSGKELWRFEPNSYGAVVGSPQITTATPVSDREWIYAASPDGRIHKLRVSDGRESGKGPWPVAVTTDPGHEKLASSLNLSRSRLLVTTGGYIGDAPPYQGKVVSIDRASGRITSVFNSLCSDRRRIIAPASCRASGNAIWGRAGAVVNPADHHVLVTTSNGPFDGRNNWGDSVLELSAGALRLLRHYTPREQAALESADVDLGSTSPALLPDPGSGRPSHLLQGGKDGKLRLLALPGSLHGTGGGEGRALGGERQIVPAPGNTDVFTAIAVRHRRGTTEAFVATNEGTAAYELKDGRLRRLWSNRTPGTSPVVAGGVLWIYDPGGALVAYRPRSGKAIRRFKAPPGHWNSPIVAGGRVYLPSGDANQHRASGTLSIFTPR